MASYTVAARARGADVVLATNDKDLFQLVDDRVRVYSTNKADLASPKDAFALLGPESVQKKWGVAPPLIADVLSLVGDSVDNIPGVNGLGPKGAASLLNEHGSLVAILNDPDSVKNERIREKLKAARTQIIQNREMVRLDLDLELPQPLDHLSIEPRYPELIAQLEKCDFNSLLLEVKAEAAARVPSAPAQRQAELF